jgi:hypothetical protein
MAIKALELATLTRDEIIAMYREAEEELEKERSQNAVLENELRDEKDGAEKAAWEAEEDRDDLAETLEEILPCLRKIKTALTEAGVNVPFEVIHCIDRADIALREASHG